MKDAGTPTVTDRNSRRFGVVGALLRVPLDAVAVVGYALGVASLTETVLPAPIRLLVALPLVCFLPGYVALTCFFPGRFEPATATDRRWFRLRGRGLAWGDRLALSFATSLVLVPLVGMALAVTGVGFDAVTVVLALSVTVVAGAVLGTARRLQLPDGARLESPPVGGIGELLGSAVDADGRFEAALNVLVVLLAVLAVGALGYGLIAPQTAEQSSAFFLLAEGPDGRLAASGYPTTVTSGAPLDLVVGIENAEGERTSYTVVTELQRLETVGGSTTVVDREPLDRFTVTLAAGERWQEARTVAPQSTGADLRLTYYLYEGDAPAQPDERTAYRTTFIWLTVESR